MARDPQTHLSPDELAMLVEEGEPTLQVAGIGFDFGEAQFHVNRCALCEARLRDHRSVQSGIRSLVGPVNSLRKDDERTIVGRTNNCPAKEKWTSIAAGISSDQESAPLLQHASACDYCGQLLRFTTDNLNSEISAEEVQLISQLPSASATWQRGLARKMAEMSAPSPKPETRTSAVDGWPLAGWIQWAGALAAGAVIALVAMILIGRSSPSLSSTNQLIAQAYSEQRPLALRFPGATYGPIRQVRGESGPYRSRMDEPVPLLKAEANIARSLTRHPHDPGWLQAKARAMLFEGHAQQAIDLLQQAQASRPEDQSVRIDLATAYYERGDYDSAVQTLRLVLSNNPNDLVALFNRAMAYQQQKKYPEAIADWHRYLQLDPTGSWADAARQQQNKLPR